MTVNLTFCVHGDPDCRGVLHPRCSSCEEDLQGRREAAFSEEVALYDEAVFHAACWGDDVFVEFLDRNPPPT